MARNLFSIPIFFIVFRETLETSIILSVLLGLVEQIVRKDSNVSGGQNTSPSLNENEEGNISSQELSGNEDGPRTKRLIRKMRLQIFAGSALGFLIAAIIGATFLAIWFTKASNLWQKSEELWEGSFNLIASLIIFVMAISMLKLDRAKTKWRVKLQHAFEGQRGVHISPLSIRVDSFVGVDGSTRTGKWALFILPLITVLREGMEAVVFIGGISLGQPAASIPIAAITGIVCGLICGFVIYTFASRSTLSIFLVVMTNFILLIGSGLFSKAIKFLQKYEFNRLLGADADSLSGDGPGTFDVRGNVWHLDCCNSENYLDGKSWLLFGALFGWTNSATLGSVLSYVFYWIAVIIILVVLKWREGRLRVFGLESTAGKERRVRQAADTSGIHEKVASPGGTDQISELPK
ncbi:iron permease FTR1 [Lactifluus subvellereus]|nr:iron permease FTR1 [Lactifluus subvellereus]